MPSSSEDHERRAAGQQAVCAVLTISDTRTEADDASGDLIRKLLTDAGHEVSAKAIVRDEPADIEARLTAWGEEAVIQVICCTGGTGMSRRDSTIEVVERMLDKPLGGFGELFRMLSWDQIGAAAMLSRATAGLMGSAIVFAMPGSTGAVELAMTRLIVPQLPHLIWERGR